MSFAWSINGNEKSFPLNSTRMPRVSDIGCTRYAPVIDARCLIHAYDHTTHNQTPQLWQNLSHIWDLEDLFLSFNKSICGGLFNVVRSSTQRIKTTWICLRNLDYLPVSWPVFSSHTHGGHSPFEKVSAEEAASIIAELEQRRSDCYRDWRKKKKEAHADEAHAIARVQQGERCKLNLESAKDTNKRSMAKTTELKRIRCAVCNSCLPKEHQVTEAYQWSA